VVIPVRLKNVPQGLTIEEYRSSFTIQGKFFRMAASSLAK